MTETKLADKSTDQPDRFAEGVEAAAKVRTPLSKVFSQTPDFKAGWIQSQEFNAEAIRRLVPSPTQVAEDAQPAHEYAGLVGEGDVCHAVIGGIKCRLPRAAPVHQVAETDAPELKTARRQRFWHCLWPRAERFSSAASIIGPQTYSTNVTIGVKSLIELSRTWLKLAANVGGYFGKRKGASHEFKSC